MKRLRIQNTFSVGRSITITVIVSLTLIICATLTKPKAETHDNSSILGYNGFAVCEFADKFLSNLQSRVTGQEWNEIRRTAEKAEPYKLGGKPRDFALVVYETHGLTVEYIYQNKNINIVGIEIAGTRLPSNMQHKTFFSKSFKISEDRMHGDVLQVGCDMNEVTAHFKGESTIELRVRSDYGII